MEEGLRVAWKFAKHQQLEEYGHMVEYEPAVTHKGERFYHVDGLPRTEGQILAWVVDGVRPRS